MEILAVKKLSFCYAGESAAALAEIDLSVRAGDVILLAGGTGSGKSTLLRLIKREIAPRGDLRGGIEFFGRPIGELSDREAAARVGYVAQRPEEQIATDRVYHELAFGAESLGWNPALIRRRVAEVASFFGIDEWFDRSTNDLSGGQRQLLTVASVIVTSPDILLLDEPTSRLDPIAAADLISAVLRLNRELGTTLIIAEHRMEDILPYADRLAVLCGGRMVLFDTPRRAAAAISEVSPVFAALPAAARLWISLGAACGGGGECPVSVKEGRAFFAELANASKPSPNIKISPKTKNEAPAKREVAAELRHVFFRYTRDGEDALRGLNIKIMRGEIYCLLGGNGSGKSTALSVAAALRRPYAGSVRIFGRRPAAWGEELYSGIIGYLPQEAEMLFLHDSVEEELSSVGMTLADLPPEFDLPADRHPFDLSGGQREMLALAKVLARRPRILMLDEPTKGLDGTARAALAALLCRLRDEGVTVIAVTHDAEFAADVATVCGFLFRGELISEGGVREFFSGNELYTTPAARITRGIADGCVTVSEARTLIMAGGGV